ncbi:16S rRNA (guanine(966)-N(2))-methyltransferase RsmD [Jongsikchunia kroppenstedtii]|uniref:16S rRNA (guanine(966)-N(2))-methyltransferase RsmD n=1 Tax=Jongsikchunia kroppenstedtii TaxID=1121721 RepID=UPI00037FC461|nr:16S rRNA (guanine(966)-N(2))-methyltransferase RsmD [Jongsikchunia kroppenstedtii]
MTRIIAGTARGRRLSVPADGTRPTSDRVRESVFNMLNARIDLDDTAVLDLYAGSGALGLEALSRGAAHAALVESDAAAARTITGNIASTALTGAEVIRQPVEKLVSRHATRRYDIVLLDPPYAKSGDELAGVLADLVRNGWLADDAYVVVERGRRAGELQWPDGLEPEQTKKYGDTVVIFAVAR